MQHNMCSKKERMWLVMALLMLTALNIIIWSEVLQNETIPDMQIFFFDVGQGDSAFIRTRDGTQILIDGGPDGRVLSEIKDHMPYYDRTIDIVIATHPHKDHITGIIEVMQRYRVDTFIESGAIYSGPEFYELQRVVRQNGASRLVLRKPTRISFFDGAVIDISMPLGDVAGTAPKNIHDANIVGLLEFQKKTVLFMGDAEKKSENALVSNRAIRTADILKVGHHGSKTSSTSNFLKIVHPQYSIVSVGKNNYGHPHQIALDNLKNIGSQILRTDVVGTVVAEIRGGVLHTYIKR